MARERIRTLEGLSDGEYLTVADVASVLKVDYSTAYDFITTGRIGFLRFGRCIRVEVAALRKFIESARRGPRA